ncbi:uncharacterized protein N7479_006526 [Penicillium vulpinum]|uniref:Uncharacterized protein n=1 Tax=Penicillium vulpinum TaxID=29845 RepID=A0A1V6S327_9EURO|nr:uncharacterized protein N7479_006526 [Penicillium vulpinum]KAJ5959376.1 hypothetical protein N7479_006526 [Penicillium vulpinum]OQE08043.1 hypothetical protein PENVUL_c011G01160 [Penicillium vulpinum]
MLRDEGKVFNRTVPGLPCEDLVVRLCEQQGLHFNTLTYSARAENSLIKYNNVTIEEAHVQLFFRLEVGGRTNNTIRIPKVYYAFEAGGRGQGFTYVIMEHIDLDYEKTTFIS